MKTIIEIFIAFCIVVSVVAAIVLTGIHVINKAEAIQEEQQSFCEEMNPNLEYLEFSYHDKMNHIIECNSFDKDSREITTVYYTTEEYERWKI